MLISAILPTYNRQGYIERALLSILAQSFPVDECLVIDDGSDDSTKEIVHSLAKTTAVPIVYLYQENKGPAAARNKGIEYARGEYLAFLDSDDLWEKKKIEYQYLAMRRFPEYKISHTAEKWFRRGQHLNQKKKHRPQSGDIFYQSLKLCAVGMSTVMANKKLFEEFGKFDQTFPCCEDYEFWLRIASREPFLLVDRPLTVKHGGRDDQVSSIHRVGMDVFRIRALEKLLDEGFFTEQSKIEAAKRELSQKCRIYAKGCLKHGKKHEAEKYFKKIQVALSAASGVRQ